MLRAYEQLKEEDSNGRTASEELDIRPTHLYLKFKPQTEEELDLLTMDTALILYEYPLDYEIEEGGLFYHDPEIPLGQPTYQYVAVTIDQKLPVVEYDLLAELYIPEEDGDLDDDATNGRTEGSWIVDQLVDKALELTGNQDGEEASANARASKWTPKGRITMTDDMNGDGVEETIPIEGAAVRARRWFRTLKGNSNANGDYVCSGPRFRKPANYSIHWEKDNFKVRDAWLSEAKFDGPKRKGDWNPHITAHKAQYYATIFRAAFHYYYKPIEGLRRPPENGFLNVQMKIKATYQNEDLGGSGAFGTHWNTRRFWGSQIKIFSKSRTKIQLYSTTIHELAHASHWRMDHQDFRNTNAKVAESWARGVEWVLTRMRYPNYLGRLRRTDDYTLVVADMIDGPATFGTRTNEGFRDADGVDNVEGYTIRQIEDALRGSRQWGSWQQSIIDYIDNPTEGNLNVLFNAYN